MTKFASQVTGLRLLPNRQTVVVELLAQPGCPSAVELTDPGAVTLDGQTYRGWGTLLEWFQGSEDTVYTVVSCAVEYDGPHVTAARFERK